MGFRSIKKKEGNQSNAEAGTNANSKVNSEMGVMKEVQGNVERADGETGSCS
jgi:hypothetical protein